MIPKLAAVLRTLQSVSNHSAPMASRGIRRLANVLPRTRYVFNRCAPMASRGIRKHVDALSHPKNPYFASSPCVPMGNHAIRLLVNALPESRGFASSPYAPTASDGTQSIVDARRISIKPEKLKDLKNRAFPTTPKSPYSVFNPSVPTGSRAIQPLVNALPRSRRFAFNRCAPTAGRGIQSLVDAPPDPHSAYSRSVQMGSHVIPKPASVRPHRLLLRSIRLIRENRSLGRSGWKS